MKPYLLVTLLSLLVLCALLAACDPEHSAANTGKHSTFTPNSSDRSTTSPLSATQTTPVVPTVTAPPLLSPITTILPSTTTPLVTAFPTTTPTVVTTAPVTTAPLPETVEPENPWVVTCNEYVTLRKRPSSSSGRITTIPNGETVDLHEFSGTYARVTYQNKTGYVMATYLTLPKDRSGTEADLTVVKPVENYSYEQMQTDLRILAEAFPDLLTLSSIGKSEEGRDLTLCILGNPQAERRVFLQSAIHGREHMVTLLTIAQIDYMLHHQEMEIGNDLTVGKRLEQIAIHIVPMSNPDGVCISQTGILPEAFIGMYDAPEEIARIWKANANGIDLNANFDTDWENYTSIHDTDVPDYMGYNGSSPECAAESKAIAEYLRENPFDLILSYHTSGSLIYWSYDAENLPKLNAKNLELAKLLAKDSGFTLGEQATTSTAGLKDYAIQTLGTPSLTIEFAATDSPVPLREFEQTWARSKHMLLTSALWVLGKA